MQSEFEIDSINKNQDIVKILNEVYKNFLVGKFEKSIELLEEALKIDFEYPGVTSALKCANFWRERYEKLDDISDSYEKGEFLIKQWSLFAGFISQIGESSERCLYNIKQFIYTAALENYLLLLDDTEFIDSGILLKIGRCFKGVGSYDKAIDFIEKALQLKPGSAEILAELGDCYSLINEIRLSKVFFREAFFINPRGVDLLTLESGMIKKLIKKTLEEGIAIELLNDWLPVYGTIFGVFNIKRELKSLEIGRLKQSIYQMEKILSHSPESSADLIPKLINHYFWLIDHYVSSGEDKSKIEEILKKIKILNIDIYKEYTN